MLEAVGAGALAKSKQNWAEIWSESNERKLVTEEIRSICERNDPTVVLVDEGEYAMPTVSQILALTQRTFISYWRDPNYLLGK